MGDVLFRAERRCGEEETDEDDAAPVLCRLLLGAADGDDSLEPRRGDVRLGLPDILQKCVLRLGAAGGWEIKRTA